MFIGYIVAFISILVLVSIISAGVTSSSGAIESTKGVNLISEISKISLLLGKYREVATGVNYTNISNDELYKFGLLSSNDFYQMTATDVLNFEVEQAEVSPLTLIEGDILIKSKAIPGIYYKIAWVSANLIDPITLLPNTNIVELYVIADKTVIINDSSFAKIIDSNYLKLSSSATLISTFDNDGASIFILK